MPFDPNADFQVEHDAVASTGPAKPFTPQGPELPPADYAQKVAALQAHMQATKDAGPTGSMPGFGGALSAAALGAANAAGIPGAFAAGGGIASLAGGGTFKSGYLQNTQAQNNLMAAHPVASAAGAIGGTIASPLTKAVGALSLPYRALVGGAQGAAQGAGTATNLDELKHNAGLGGAIGAGSMVAGDAIGKGAQYIGGKLGNARNKLIDYFAGKGEEAIAKNPKLSVLGNDANAIGAPGPRSVPELQTNDWLRTPEEKGLARTAAKAVPILQRTRPESAIVQTMGPEYVGDVIGNKTSNALADRAASQPLYKALTRIGKLGGADISGDQLSQNLQRNMAKRQLGPQSPLSRLFESATGKDLGESATEVANTADENLFYSPAAHDAGATQMEQGAKGYLDRLEKNLANRHGGGYVPKPSVSAGKATVPAGNPNAVGTAPVDMGIPVPETGAPMQAHSTFLGAGQPSSKINYSQYSPAEAADIGGAAERMNAINIGRNNAPTTQLSHMIQPAAMLPAKPGALGHVARAYALATNPGRATIAQLLNPSTMEGGAGLISKLGNGVSSVGRGLGNTTLHQAIRAGSLASPLGKYEDPKKTTQDFLAAHLPKESEED